MRENPDFPAINSSKSSLLSKSISTFLLNTISTGNNIYDLVVEANVLSRGCL